MFGLITAAKCDRRFKENIVRYGERLCVERKRSNLYLEELQKATDEIKRLRAYNLRLEEEAAHLRQIIIDADNGA